MQGAIKSGVALDLSGIDFSISESDKYRYDRKISDTKESLLEKLVSQKEIDASKIIEAIFPQHDAKIFISHSHKDVYKALKLSEILESHGYKCFVDSLVWGSSERFLRVIDDKYCRQEGEVNYDYHTRNASTAHVHMMLTTALQRMIHNSQYFLFLKTEHSVDLDDITDDEKTYSPWVHMELHFSSLVMPDLVMDSMESFEKSVRNFRVSHEAYSGHLFQRNVVDYKLLLTGYSSVENFFSRQSS